MSDILKIEEQGLQENKVEQIKSVYAPMLQSLEEMESKYNEIVKKLEPEGAEVTKQLAREAGDLRKKMVKIRTSAEEARKEAKQEYLLVGKVIDGACNNLKYVVSKKEGTLKNIEKHFENKEKERIAKIAEGREEELKKYGAGFIQGLGEMSESNYKMILDGQKARWEAEEKAKKEQEELGKKQQVFRERKEQLLPYKDFIRVADLTLDTSDNEFKLMLGEAKRKKAEERKKQDELKAENERLRKQQEEKDEIIKYRHDIIVKLEDYIEEKLDPNLIYGLTDDKFEEIVKEAKTKKKEADEKSAKLVSERNKWENASEDYLITLGYEKVAKGMKHSQYNHKIEKSDYSGFESENAFKGFKEHIDAMVFKFAEENKKKAEAEKQRKAEMAPDKEKIETYFHDLSELNIPKMKSNEGKEVMREIVRRQQALAEWASKELEKLS